MKAEGSFPGELKPFKMPEISKVQSTVDCFKNPLSEGKTRLLYDKRFELEEDLDVDFNETTMLEEVELTIEESGIPHLAESGFLGEKELLEYGVAKDGENIFDIFRRVTESIKTVEQAFSDSEKAAVFADELHQLMLERKIIPSSPTLMNAGTASESTLSACVVPRVELGGDFRKVEEVVNYFHVSGMGTGFNFDVLDDPIPVIEQLNRLGLAGQESGRDVRPVGNMGALSVDHDKILDFIEMKKGRLDEKWVFNFSVLLDDVNVKRILNSEDIVTKNGSIVSSDVLMLDIARSIHADGEPGLVFIDRLNKGNQVPSTGEYQTLAPCGEVGLVEGETCQFCYVNLGEFVSEQEVDYKGLEQAVRTSMRFLDDAVEYNIAHYDDELSKNVAGKRRKVGLGVCGFADFLAKLGVQYQDGRSRDLAEDVFSFINYISKSESVELAKERGPFGAFGESKYTQTESIIYDFASNPTKTVSAEMWLDLDREIKESGLRNCATTAIPPTSRSSRIIGASPSVEPYFEEMLGISPEEQLMMVSSIQKFVDESISKTINIPEEATVEQIRDILLLALKSNVKGITIYRDKSRSNQPEKVKK